MKIDKMNKFSIIFSFFVFMSINLPTVKFLYPSELMNIFALLGVLGVGIIRWAISNEPLLNIDSRQLRFSVSFVLLWQFIFSVTWINRPTYFGATDLLQYLSVILFAFGVLIFLKKEDLKFILGFQIGWGTLFAFLEWTVGVPKSRELGQTYLTAGVVIAATIVVVLGLLFSKEINKLIKLVLLPALLILYGGISSLSGRAPILLSLIVPVIVYIFSILFEKNLMKKVGTLISFTIMLSIAAIALYNVLPATTINRIMRIFVDIQSEPRYEVYNYAATIIFENPLGIGLRGYRDFNSGYPHNILLEVAMSGGIIAVLPFIGIVCNQIGAAVEVIRDKNINLIWLNLSLYYLLTWNISFDLSSSYMVFISIALLIKSQSLYNQDYNYRSEPIRLQSKNLRGTLMNQEQRQH